MIIGNTKEGGERNTAKSGWAYLLYLFIWNREFHLFCAVCSGVYFSCVLIFDDKFTEERFF